MKKNSTEKSEHIEKNITEQRPDVKKSEEKIAESDVGKTLNTPDKKESIFTKGRSIFRFKRKDKSESKKVGLKEAERFSPSLNAGLTSEQVKARKNDELTNQVKSTGGKTISQIICSNVFTFFNILLLLIAISLWVFGQITSTYFILIAIINT